MTREEAKDKMLTESVQYKNGLRTVALRKINNFIDKIFDDHEAQLKLASDVYSTDKMHMYQELKAKDKITQDIKEAYELKSIAYDLLLEAIKLKDEEIERMKAELAIATKRFDAKNREGKALKKTLSMAWSKQLKEQQ